MERMTPRGPPGHPHQGETSACWQLTVRVLEARSLGWADLLGEADPYVILQLPTAPGTKFKTKTVTNSSHPVWNETFTFLIQSQVKNVLELSIYDKDAIKKDDACFKVLCDVSEVLPGRLLRKTFSLHPQGPEELDVEFLMEKTSGCPENLITNNVLVARELSCLDIHLDSAGSTAEAADQDELELELVLKGSYEDTQTSALGTASAFRFHYMAAQEAELSGCLRTSKSNVWNSGNSVGHLTMPLRSLAMGKEVTVDVPATNAPGVKLQLKAESCPKELAVHLGFDLCAEEKAFLSRRKQVVAKALKQALQLDRDLQEDEVPVVGIMATGGGARAMTSLYGHLLALQKLGLLDCVTYFSGISGSTWTMAHLYGDPEWSQRDLKGPIGHAREHLAKSKLEAFSPARLASYHGELEQRAEQGHPTTFVDLWGLVLEFALHGQVMDQKLSGQRAALERGQNPLPLYLSLNVKKNNLQTLDFKEWVEFSPYEVGFLKYGAFIPSELFGSEFFMGRLMRRIPESRICFLEGIWSNIFSLNLLDAWYDLTSSSDTWKQHIKDKLRNLEEPPPSSGTSSGPEALWLQPGTALAQTLKGFLTRRPLYQRSSNFLQGLQLHQDYCAQKDFSTWADCQVVSSAGQLTPQEPQLCLVDAGFYLNTSCPSMFRPGRRLDLILSFDYSLSSPFEVLQQTELDFRARGLPFPRVEPSPQDRLQPRECYLFSDPTCPDAPVLLHFPLVNASFKDHSAPGVQRSPAELPAGQVDLTTVTSPYSMFNMTYKEEDFDCLLQLSDYNVRNSQGTILKALRTSLRHRAPGARSPGPQT
ncbi:cytosolic phospholipase A2 delta isoform X1 [Physeter macrocephalus]|uniref:Phospholipase A2 n=1 Tax=Physeter macrocephalus TaxID=9755 RepID=A0A2Y9FDP9_PHYMC|nr:cytosolic phospholipase A2 delta isoform X1 [Physeter catodon]|eukprot:XP_007120580.2 cytosolic phospholipase A2 delta [Physeter catodon]